jgi:hypothetical protein
MDEEIMALVSLEWILNLIYLASVLVMLGYDQRTEILADIGNAIGIEWGHCP